MEEAKYVRNVYADREPPVDNRRRLTLAGIFGCEVSRIERERERMVGCFALICLYVCSAPPQCFSSAFSVIRSPGYADTALCHTAATLQ
jgi:hypothetical protein